MNVLRRNILANLFGRAWTNLLGILLVPIYLRFVGVEAYGLIGFAATLQQLLALLDLGLGTTLNREMARLSIRDGQITTQRDLLRTLEAIYWGVSVLIAIIVLVGAGAIAKNWVNADRLPVSTVTHAIQLAGAIIAVQLPAAFYQGGLMGLQRQALVNAVHVLFGTLRGLGGVLVLWKISSTIEAFLVWQFIVGAGQLGAMSILLWRELPSDKAARFNAALLRDVWRYAATVSGNSVVGFALTQLDKVLLSGILSLTSFGYYTLASTVASGLWSIIVPINSALFPRFAQLVELRESDRLVHLYHKAAQLVAVLVVPTGVMLAVFSRDIIVLWTGNPTAASEAGFITTILVAGTIISGITSIPSYLQVASGKPQLIMYTNAVSALVLIPSLIFLARSFGAAGGAAVWLLLNAGHLCIMVPLIHRRLVPGEFVPWLLCDVALPVVGVVVVGAAGRVLAPVGASSGALTLYLAVLWGILSLTAILLAPHVRTYVRRGLVGLFATPVAQS